MAGDRSLSLSPQERSEEGFSLRRRFHPPLVMVVTAVRWLGPKALGRSEGIELDQGQERLAHRLPSIQPLCPHPMPSSIVLYRKVLDRA